MTARDIKLTNQEYVTLITGRMNQLQYFTNMVKGYLRMTDEQREKSPNGPFSLDSLTWRAASNITHTGTFDEIVEEFLGLAEGFARQARDTLSNVKIR